MSDIIQLLPDNVANQIAAGEVIQRPASVIKELVENAVDAGAKKIDIIIVDAGRTLIQVIDDGKGMSPTDARLAFERHATSKISKAEDLFALHTMGFRGEALASIAAVAQVELRTRTADSQLGTLVNIEANKVTGQEPCSCNVGSNFKVCNLFYNVPARRRFLKSNATEMTNIMQAFERIALVYPDIHFTVNSNGNDVYNLPCAPLRQRILDLFGKKIDQSIIPVEVKTSLCEIYGFTGKPESARKKESHQFFFVNGRYMRHPYFHKAVITAYERLLPEGGQVPYFIYFDVDTASIDVNIHPTKTEIKFENEQAIWQILLATVRGALGQYNGIPSIDFDTEGRPDIPMFNPQNGTAPPPEYIDKSFNPFKTNGSSGAEGNIFAAGNSGDGGNIFTGMNSSDSGNIFTGGNTLGGNTFGGGSYGGNTNGGSSYGGNAGFGQNNYGNKPAPAGWQDLYAGASGSLRPSSMPTGQSLPFDGEEPVDSGVPQGLDALADKSPAHYQYKGQYIMTAVKSGLMIIDQHRAHTRVLYDEYMEKMRNKTIETQRLLFPEPLSLSPSDTEALRGVSEELANLGFLITENADGGFVVSGVPAGTEGIDHITLLSEMLVLVQETGSEAKDAVIRKMAFTLARASAIPAGQVLQNEEMENLVNRLFASSNVNLTPDGKTILCILPEREIVSLLG